MGESVSATSTVRASRRTPVSEALRSDSPWRTRRRSSVSCARCGSTIRSATSRPMIDSALCPKRRSAGPDHEVTRPSGDVVNIASSEVCATAERMRSCSALVAPRPDVPLCDPLPLAVATLIDEALPSGPARDAGRAHGARRARAAHRSSRRLMSACHLRAYRQTRDF